MTLQIPLLGKSSQDLTDQKFRKQLRPAGHNAFAEWMVGFITPVGSTALVIIACYVLAQLELGRILSAKGQPSDYFVAGLVFVLGAMVDTAIIVTAARFKMHVARGRRELPWAIITGTMLFLCLSVEAMTLMYFGWLVSPESVPPYVVDAVKHIHDILFFIRNGLPPVIIAFFTTCLMPLSVETSDRDRAAKSSSSMNIAALQEDLVRVGLTATPEDKLVALENQIAVNEHSSRATDEERDRNVALINQLRRNYGLAPRATQDALTEAQAQAMIAQAMASFDAQTVLGQFIADTLGQQQADMTVQIDETLEARLQSWATQLRDEITQLVQGLLAPPREPAFSIADSAEGASQSNDTAPATTRAPQARKAPRPGTKFFNQMVYDAASRLLGDKRMTLYNIAQELKIQPQEAKDALTMLRNARINQLKPGSELDPDPVFDALLA